MPRPRTNSDRAQAKANAAAQAYVKRNHPRVWARLLDDAYTSLGLARRTVGRPKREERHP